MKDDQIKTLQILKDVMMTFHKIIYLVADFVRVRTYRVVKNRKIISKFLRHYQSKLFLVNTALKPIAYFNSLTNFH